MEQRTKDYIGLFVAGLLYANVAERKTKMLGGPELSIPVNATAKVFSGYWAIRSLISLGYSEVLSTALILGAIGGWEWHLVSRGKSSSALPILPASTKTGWESWERREGWRERPWEHERHHEDRWW
jgi:hypothetical protein